MPDSTKPKDAPVIESNTLVVEDDFLKHGFIQLPKVLLYARNLSRDAKLLYAILLGYAWQEQRCWPGYARLCDDMGASENMVRKYMRELEEIGLLRQRRRGQGRPNLYTLPALRTSKIEVQEPQKTTGPEPQFSQGELETRKKNQLHNSNDSKGTPPVIAETQRRRAQSTVVATVFQELAVPDHPQSSTRCRIRRKRKASPTLMVFMEELSREFHDEDSIPQNIAQVLTLLDRSGLEERVFIAAVYECRAVTKQANIHKPANGQPGLRNKMPYFFAVLRDWLGLEQEGPEPMQISEEELQASLDIQALAPPSAS